MRRVGEQVGGPVEGDRLGERDPAGEDQVVADAELGGQRPQLGGVRIRTRTHEHQLPAPELRPGSRPARSSPSWFLYAHSEDTNTTNGLVMPYFATCARAAAASPGLNRSWSMAS